MAPKGHKPMETQHWPTVIYAHGHAFAFPCGIASGRGGECMTCGAPYPDPEDGYAGTPPRLVFNECPAPTPLPNMEG